MEAGSRALHITHGVHEWKRLEQASQAAFEWDVEDDAAGIIGSVKVAPDVIGLLWETVSELLNSYSSLPARGRSARCFRRSET